MSSNRLIAELKHIANSKKVLTEKELGLLDFIKAPGNKAKIFLRLQDILEMTSLQEYPGATTRIERFEARRQPE